LGTGFGISVADNGATEVFVFEGKVEAHATANGLSLTQNQAARIAAGRVQAVEPAARANQFVREIIPPPVVLPRTRYLTFNRSVEGSIHDSAGLGTGLTH